MMTPPTSWYSDLWTAIFWFMTVAGMFKGVNSLTRRGIHREAVWMVLGSGAVLIATGAFAVVMQNSAAGLYAYDQQPIKQLAHDWGEQMAPEARSQASIAYVTSAFVQKGTVLKFVDCYGQWQTFSPTLNDLQAREKTRSTQIQLRESIRYMLRISWSWVLCGVLAVVVGYLTGWRQRHLADRNTDHSS